MKNKGGIPLMNIIGALVAIMFLMFIGYFIYNTHKIMKNDCLIKVAEDYCEEKGLFYSGSYWDFSPAFYCKEEIRQVGEDKTYTFLEKDLERCLN